MAEDPALPITDVQFVLGHAQLTTTQIYLTPRKEEVIRRVLAHHLEQARQAAARSPAGPGTGVPARDAGCAVPERRVVTVTASEPGVLARAAPTGREAARARFPARPVPAAWPATRQSRGQVQDRLTREPFVGQRPYREDPPPGADVPAGLAGGHSRVRPGRNAGWPAAPMPPAPPGGTARPAGCTSRACPPAWRLDALASALLAAISADVVRPALGWLVVKATGPGSLVRHLARARDPEGFARLRAVCDADPHVSGVSGSHTVYRAAEIVAAKGGRLGDITVGDLLELLDTELDTLTSVPVMSRCPTSCCGPRESSAPTRPRPAGDTQHRAAHA